MRFPLSDFETLEIVGGARKRFDFPLLLYPLTKLPLLSRHLTVYVYVVPVLSLSWVKLVELVVAIPFHDLMLSR